MHYAIRPARVTVWLAALWLFAAGDLVAQRAPPGFADPVLGRWDLTILHPDRGAYPSWLDIRLRTEWQLMGSFVGRFGSMRHIRELDYAGDRLVFTVPTQYEGNATDLRFEAVLENDRLSGTTIGEDGAALAWHGVRAPALQREAAPSWGEPMVLFNGRDLTGWRPRSDEPAGCWAVDAGALVVTPPCVDLISEKRFDDFRLHVEFTYPQGSNSGLYLRGRYEVQIQDDRGKAPDPLRMGGVYGFLAPSADAARAANEWQTYDLTLIGRRITVVLNGTEVIADREIPGITGGAIDSDEGAPGPLMLQGDHGPIRFRNIVLTPGQ